MGGDILRTERLHLFWRKIRVTKTFRIIVIIDC